MDWLNFRHLYSFWMVWKCGGFRRAAEKMRVAQSAVSDQVGQLESYLGKELLIRSRRKIELTGTGRVLFDYAENIFFQAQEINQVIRDDVTSFFPASVNIGMVGGISRNFVSRFVSSVQRSYPETYCQIMTGSVHELFSKLESHDLHLVFSIEIPQKEEMKSISCRKILQSEMCLAGRKDVMTNLRETEKMSKGQIPFYEFTFGYSEDVLLVLEKHLGFEPRVFARSDDIPLLRFLANSRSGVALLPKVGVMDDAEEDQMDMITIPELGSVHINGYFSRSGPYREVAEKVLQTFEPKL